MPTLRSKPARLAAVWLPVAGVAVFIMLYLCAASLYPGGTRADPHTHGYGHVSNYWCDLLDSSSYSGEPNRGRPFAVIGTVVLPLFLIPIWARVPVLFRAESRWRHLVQIAGAGSMVFSTLIFTSAHDLAINVASILGFLALGVTILNLASAGRTAIAGLALLFIALGSTNYFMWQTGRLLWAMPTVQKTAFVSFFAWVVVTSLAIRRALITDSTSGE
jgi:hypothetical protein